MQHGAEVLQRVGIVGLAAQGLAQRPLGFVIAVQFQQHGAQIVVALGIIRQQGNRLLYRRNRLL